MSVKAFRTQPFQTTHENRAFDALYEELQRVWGASDELVVLLGNFYSYGSEIDVAVIKRDSISVIDLKDYEGKISFSENGRWLAGEVEVKGGNKRNPYQQIRTNKFALLDSLNDVNLPSGRKPNYGHISGLVVFHRPIEFDHNQLPRTISPWFHVVDLDHTAERLSQITSRGIDLTTDDIEAIVDALSIPIYIPVGAQPAVSAPCAVLSESEEPPLPENLVGVVSRIQDFLDSSNPVLIVSGMAGTGTELLYRGIVEMVTAQGKNGLVLAPNRRMADRYPVDAESLYSHVYTTKPKIEKEQLVFNCSENRSSDTQVYIVGDCHLVSDSKFETDILRYGTGQLLTDFLTFADVQGSSRKVIFIGDPFQMARGKLEETALNSERIHALTGAEVARENIDKLRPEMAENPYVENCVDLAEIMNQNKFNRISLHLDGENCVELPHEQTERIELVRVLFSDLPRDCKFVAFSHKEVNDLNAWVRKNVFSREGPLAKGDIVHIHNGLSAQSSEMSGCTVFVPNDSFVEVVSVEADVLSIAQSLRGRENPVQIDFLRVHARIHGHQQAIEFLCLKDYLYAEKPELDIDTLLALRVDAESRFKQQDEGDGTTSDLPGRQDRLAQFLLQDPYLNAARMRFGYALTLHRAQGQKFDSVIANLETGQGKTNDAYVRWLYTLFTLPRRALFLSNVPNISPLDSAEWDAKRSRLDTVRPTNIVPYDPGKEIATDADLGFEIEGKELRNLFCYIDSAIKRSGCRVVSLDHHSYQEVYEIEAKQQKKCRLRLFYNKRFHVTRIEIVESEPQDLSSKVIQVITNGLRFEDNQQQEIYDLIFEKLDPFKIKIVAVEHAAYLETYYIETRVGDVKLHIYYDGNGFINKLSPVAHSDPAALNSIQTALGL